LGLGEQLSIISFFLITSIFSKNLPNFAYPKMEHKNLKIAWTQLKVAFSQKGMMRSSFLQTDEPNHFPELEFCFFSFQMAQIMSNKDMKLL